MVLTTHQSIQLSPAHPAPGLAGLVTMSELGGRRPRQRAANSARGVLELNVSKLMTTNLIQE